MNNRRFTVGLDAADGSRYWLKVAMYETADQLQRAAQKHRPEHGGLDYWSNCGGCFQPHTSRTTYLGIMRLCDEHLGAEVVIHESVHAAIAFTYRSLDLQVIHLNPYSSHSMANREEVLAGAVHGISMALLTELGMAK